VFARIRLFTVYQNASLCCGNQLGQGVHESGFSASSGADNAEHLTLSDGKGNVVENQEIIVFFGQVLDHDAGVLVIGSCFHVDLALLGN
jgi:hypothetical protein